MNTIYPALHTRFSLKHNTCTQNLYETPLHYILILLSPFIHTAEHTTFKRGYTPDFHRLHLPNHSVLTTRHFLFVLHSEFKSFCVECFLKVVDKDTGSLGAEDWYPFK